MSKKLFSLKYILSFGLLVMILGAVYAHFMAKKVAKEGVQPKEIIISVAGSTIDKDTFEDMFLKENPELSELEDGYNLNALKREFAHKLADNIILKKYAKESGIFVTKEELEDELSVIKEGYSEEHFNEMLDDEEMTIDALRGSIMERLLIIKVSQEKIYKDIAVTEAEVEEFYDRFKSNYIKPEMFKIDRITVQDEARAEEVYKKLKSKELDFLQAKEEYFVAQVSLDGSETDFIPASGISEESYRAIDGLNTGEITGVINNAAGYHIIKLIDRTKAGQLTFDEVKEPLKRLLMEKKERLVFMSFINNLREEQNVVISEDYFRVPEDEV